MERFETQPSANNDRSPEEAFKDLVSKAKETDPESQKNRHSNIIQLQLAYMFYPDASEPFEEWVKNDSERFRNLIDNNPEIKEGVEKGDESIIKIIFGKLSH